MTTWSLFAASYLAVGFVLGLTLSVPSWLGRRTVAACAVDALLLAVIWLPALLFVAALSAREDWRERRREVP